MAESSLPSDIIRRIETLEGQVRDLQRSQNPTPPSILDLSDVSGVPTTDRLVMRYNRATGTWSAAPGGQEAGSYIFTASLVDPAGALFCDGGLYLRATYPDLFAAIGTTYGSSSGSNFAVPDYRDRMPIGAGGAKALAATGGSADAIVVSHTHGTGDHASGTEAGGFGLGASASFTDRVMVTASPGISSGSAGASGTGANLPPWLACYVFIRY
jgi:microcystin-dependent protein